MFYVTTATPVEAGTEGANWRAGGQYYRAATALVETAPDGAVWREDEMWRRGDVVSETPPAVTEVVAGMDGPAALAAMGLTRVEPME
jgi:hypothetical protein